MVTTGGYKGGRVGRAPPPLATWASAQNALKVAIFRLKIENIFWGGAMPPRGQCPLLSPS